jgi:C1A family cysteine protease
MDTGRKKCGMGWLPDLPDVRDYGMDHNTVSTRLKQVGQKDSIKSMLEKLGAGRAALKGNPNPIIAVSSDLRGWCSDIEDQEELGSCTAQAGVGIMEYFERRAFGKHIDASRLFLYKTTRNLMHLTGDTGAYLRETMKAMVLFGIPPEEYMHYDIAVFDNEPSAFCYSFAQNYQAISYFRLDTPGITREDLLKRIKLLLSVNVPSMFGFTVYNSYTQARTTGEIPYPAPGDHKVGGHAVVAVGHDDKKKIKNTNPGGEETTGAILIRNSWGKDWGDKGYGWLPYKYVLAWQAVDWWSLLKNEWIDTKHF